MAKIPVVLCIDSRIILGTAVTIKSMLETAKPETTYDIRIFHSGLSASDEKNIQELVAGTRHELKLHYIDPARFDGAPRNKGSWTEIVYYRLLTPEILTEYDKAIYSDVDVLKGLYVFDHSASDHELVIAHRHYLYVIVERGYPSDLLLGPSVHYRSVQLTSLTGRAYQKPLPVF